MGAARETIHDVARIAEVSLKIASHVLNDVSSVQLEARVASAP